MKSRIILTHLGLLLLLVSHGQADLSNMDGVAIYDQNPWYWQFNNLPTILRGGSDDDNLFQWSESQLTEHLDLLASVKGNYVRNTLSDRDEGNVFAFMKLKNGKFDLNRWNDNYWNKLAFFLDETRKRNVVVQLTLWDKFDISGDRWDHHPWNPVMNVNLDEQSWKNRDDFYSTVDRNALDQIKYQQSFIDKVLDLTLDYNHVLYNINNESSESGNWENYWADYIKTKAEKAGREIYITNMQLSAYNAIRHVMSNPDYFNYIDISQTNQDSKGARGPAHWDYLMFLRQKIASFGPMPMNNVKIYGATDGMTNFSAGSETEAIDRFWRNIFAGCASVRFHRPSVPNKRWGSGLNDRVQTNLLALQMLLEKLDIYSCNPQNDLLYPSVPIPSMMEADVTAHIGNQYAIYFPQGRFKVKLDPWIFTDKMKLQWLDINDLKWSEPTIVEVDWRGGKKDWGYQGFVTLETPSNRQCIALLEVIE